VITTLNTMVKKQYLTRKKEGKTSLFVPRITRKQVSQSVLGGVVKA